MLQYLSMMPNSKKASLGKFILEIELDKEEKLKMEIWASRSILVLSVKMLCKQFVPRRIEQYFFFQLFKNTRQVVQIKYTHTQKVFAFHSLILILVLMTPLEFLPGNFHPLTKSGAVTEL